MKFADYRLRWLTERADTLLVEGGGGSELTLVDMCLPAHIGSATMSTENLSLGITVFHGRHKFTAAAAGSLIPLTEFESVYPERSLTIQTAFGGQFCHLEEYPKKELIFRPGHSLIRYADQVKVKAYLDGSSNSEMIALYLSNSALDVLIGSEARESMLAALSIHEVPSVVVHPVQLETSRILLSITKSNLTGVPRKLYAQSKILEYLSAFIASLKSPGSTMERPNMVVANRVMNYLLSVDGPAPTLVEIAKEFDLPAQKLNQIFFNIYGETVYGFLRNHRLELAHEALEKSMATIKTIAWNLGYSHPNHFIAAFKNKFGYTPGSLRRRK